MAKRSINQLKDLFRKGDRPKEQDFADLLDSFIHRDEDISKILIKIASMSEAEAGNDNVKHMTPLLTKKAIYALTKLADIPCLATEVQQKIDNSINELLLMEDADTLINTVKDVLNFVQGASEDLNLIAALDSKVDKTSISNETGSTSTSNIASSKAVNNALAAAKTDATTKANLAKSSAISTATAEVRGEDVGSESPKFSLKKLYDWIAKKIANVPKWDEAYSKIGQIKLDDNDKYYDFGFSTRTPSSSNFYLKFVGDSGNLGFRVNYANNAGALQGKQAGDFANKTGNSAVSFSSKINIVSEYARTGTDLRVTIRDNRIYAASSGGSVLDSLGLNNSRTILANHDGSFQAKNFIIKK